MKKKVITYLLGIVIAILLSLLIFVSNKGFNATGSKLYGVLSDSLFVTGAIYLCFGLLFWISNQGVFDMLSFGLLKLLDLFKKNVKDSKYANYIEYKEAKKDSYLEWKFLAIIGLMFIVLAGIFLYLYTQNL